jgi:hypothetical protein
MKKSIITLAIAIFSITAMAQDRKVAVFDPAGRVVDEIKTIVREEISSVIVNADGYSVLERELIDKVLKENRFQESGLVEDSQISEMGRRMGATLVLVSSVAQIGNNYYISCKLIDVETARIEKQRTAQTQRGTSELMEVIQKITGDMFAVTAKQPEKPVQEPIKQSRPTVENITTVIPEPINSSRPVVEEKTAVIPVEMSEMLIAKVRKVYCDDELLNKHDVRELMGDNTTALLLYNKGKSRSIAGSLWLATGFVSFVGGLIYIDYISDDNLGVTMQAMGGAMLMTGITLKISSAKRIRQSVDIYNHGSVLNKTTGMELKFGITGNGVGVVLSF